MDDLNALDPSIIEKELSKLSLSDSKAEDEDAKSNKSEDDVIIEEEYVEILEAGAVDQGQSDNKTEDFKTCGKAGASAIEGQSSKVKPSGPEPNSNKSASKAGHSKQQTPKKGKGQNASANKPSPRKKFTSLGDLAANNEGLEMNQAVKKLFQNRGSSQDEITKQSLQTKKMEAIPNSVLLRTGRVRFYSRSGN